MTKGRVRLDKHGGFDNSATDLFAVSAAGIMRMNMGWPGWVSVTDWPSCIVLVISSQPSGKEMVL